MKQKLLLLVCLLSFSISQSQTLVFNDGVLEYTITDGTTDASIKKLGGICPTGDFIIPATVDNSGTTYTVTKMEYAAFWACSGLTSVNIPSTIQTLGIYDFGNCTGLTSVIVNWATPITIPAEVFYNLTLADVSLTVPAGTLALYTAAGIWENFGLIVLSTEDFKENAIAVQLYPNPVHDELHIDLSSDLSIEKVSIYNNLGQLIKQGVSSSIDVRNLKGVYFVEILTNKGKTTKQIIVE